MICHLQSIQYSKIFCPCCLCLVAVTITKKTPKFDDNNTKTGPKSCFTKVLRAVGVTVVFPENLQPSQGKLAHVRIL